MGTVELRSIADAETLVSVVQDLDEPLVVFDGMDECMVAMRPAVFERILFESELVAQVGREAFHF